MKKHLIAASLFLASTAAYGDCCPTPEPVNKCCRDACVFLASPCYSFETYFTALWLQPTTSNLDYAAEAIPFNPAIAVPIISPNWAIHEISTDYHFGFDLGVAAIFHGANSKLSLSWERFHPSSDSSSKAVGSTDMIGPFFEIGPDASSYKNAVGSVRFQFDQVNLDYGTLVNFGSRLQTHLFGGVGFVRLYQNRVATFSNVADTISRTITVPAKFMGAGPQVGVDFNYCITGGFQFVGDATASLFVGRLKSKTTYSSTTPALELLGVASPNVQETSVDNRTGIVPGFEGKLGLAYDAEFCNCYMLTLEAGYQAQIYLNSLRSIDMGSEVVLVAPQAGDVGVFARSFERNISDFSLAGPYLKIALGF